MNLLRGKPASANLPVIEEAFRALLDGEERLILMRDSAGVRGRIWEIYRSVETDSLRIRYNDHEGRVYHANSLQIQVISKL